MRYAGEWLLGVEDVSGLVAEGRALVGGGELGGLLTPRVEVYTVADRGTAERLGLLAPVDGAAAQ